MASGRGRAARGGATAVALAAVVLLAGHRAGSHPPSGPVPLSQEVGTSAAGNGRPAVVSYDGRMVRRCTAIALYVGPGGEAAGLSLALRAAAERMGVSLLPLPPGVLSPATLAVRTPDVVACLPVGAPAGEADDLLAAPLPGEERHGVEPVLIHDLTFVVRPAAADPEGLRAALDREGILTDLLGHYDVGRDRAGAVVVSYTGPLLGDSDVAAVREGIARAAETPVDNVAVGPRSLLGVGVDMAAEPAQEAAPTQHAAGHGH